MVLFVVFCNFLFVTVAKFSYTSHIFQLFLINHYFVIDADLLDDAKDVPSPEQIRFGRQYSTTARYYNHKIDPLCVNIQIYSLVFCNNSIIYALKILSNKFF